MNFDNSTGSYHYSRRRVIATTLPVGFSTIPGCSRDAEDKNNEANLEDGPREELQKVITELESIYRDINHLPIEDGDEFVFDIRAFEDEFDHQALLEQTRSIQDRIESSEFATVPEQDRELLNTVARLGEFLVRERFLTHQFIAAGLAYERRLARDEYGDASEAIRHGLEFLGRLTENGQKIEDELRDKNNGTVTIDGFNTTSIQNEQKLLRSIAQWSTTSYQGFNQAIVGFELFEDGLDSMKDERFANASKFYDRASIHFERSYELLEEAQGQGEQLQHLVPLVQHFRCVLPIYHDSSVRFADSFAALGEGNEEYARKIAREAIEEVEQKIAQCEDSVGY